MADPLANDILQSAADPTEVARQKFDLERRGFDQAQVRTYLLAVSEALRDAQDREAEIRGRLGRAIRRAEHAEASLRDQKPEDPSALNRQVGEEVTSVLDAARVAGEQKIAAAEKSAEQLMGNAKREATEVRQAAETIMGERRAEADAEASRIVGEGRSRAEELVATAQFDADTMRKDAAEDVARVREECDGLVREAEAARTEILQDMERRRRQARAQIERLRVGRDRLLRSYDVVRRTLDESTTELKSSLKEAKVLGDTAARTVQAEPLREPAQLEAEMADRRLLAKPNDPTKASKPGRVSRPGRVGDPARASDPRKVDESAGVKLNAPGAQPVTERSTTVAPETSARAAARQPDAAPGRPAGRASAATAPGSTAPSSNTNELASAQPATTELKAAELPTAELTATELPAAELTEATAASPETRQTETAAAASTAVPASTDAASPDAAASTEARRTETTAAASTEASIVPHVEMGPRAFTEQVAPTPRRPVVGPSQSSRPATRGGVPKPPAVAPTIKPPTPDPGVEAAATTTANDSRDPGLNNAEDDIEEATEAVMRTSTVGDAAPMIAADEPDQGGVAVAEPAMRDEAGDGSSEGTAEAAADEEFDFSDLPTEELAIIIASDDIEQVVAITPDPEPISELRPALDPIDVEIVASASAAVVAPAIEVVEIESAEEPGYQTVPGTERVTLDEPEPARGLFAALRQQAAAPDAVDAADIAETAAIPETQDAHDSADDVEEAAVVAAQAPVDDEADAIEEPVADPVGDPVEVARQRDVLIDELTKDIERRLKRALADEQNEVLAGLRTAGKRQVELISLVGETDDHVQRYVVAINEVAAQAYGAGAVLLDGEVASGEMPAGAVEELIGSAIVLPIRLRLIELDSIDVERAVAHLDSIRAFYRQRKTDHLTEAAESLASLLVTAGAYDALPADAGLPWFVGV